MSTRSGVSRWWPRLMTAAAVVLPVALAGVLTIPLSAKLSYQNARNDFLEDAISVLNKKIEEVKDFQVARETYLAQVAILDQLFSPYGNESVQVLSELSRVIPPGIALKTVERKGDELRVEGEALSSNHIAALTRQIPASDYFSWIVPEIAETNEETAVIRFSLRLGIYVPK